MPSESRAQIGEPVEAHRIAAKIGYSVSRPSSIKWQLGKRTTTKRSQPIVTCLLMFWKLGLDAWDAMLPARVHQSDDA